MNKQQLDWDSLRVFLAIARAGSVAAAARRLDVSHQTLIRPIAQLEERLGVSLFRRLQSGYRVTPAGKELMAVAEALESNIVAVERKIAGLDARPVGTVRVTAPDILVMDLLSPIFAEFRVAYPEINLEVIITCQRLDLNKGEADVAIRPSKPIPENLVGRKISNLNMAIYRHKDAYHEISRPEELAQAPWIGLGDGCPSLPVAKWMSEKGLEKSIVYRADSLLGCLDATRTKVGLCALPCVLGDSEDDLLRIGDIVEELQTELWLLTHPDLRNVARIRTFLDYLGEALQPLGSKFMGINQAS